MALFAALAPRSSRPVDDFTGLRDAVGDHAMMLSAGHASFGCAACHFAHAAKAQRPVWQKQGDNDSTLFARDADAAGGVKTGLCLSCHDGTVASALKAHTVVSGDARQLYQAVDLGADHPVDVDYVAALRRDPEDYNDPGMNARIVLEEGRSDVPRHATHDLSAVSAGNVRPEVCIECHRR